MRKSLIVAFAACAICSASFAPDAHSQVGPGETGTVKKTTPGCPSYQYLTNFLLTFSLAGEKEAAAAFQRYRCVALHGQEIVIIDERQNDRVCVRRSNDSDCYWMMSGDLENDGR
jgi:hypothetical protein